MSDYARVCAIDPGTRNFSFCVADNFTWRRPIQWTLVDLWPPAPGRRATPTTEDVVAVTHQWCADNDELLRSCDTIVIEKQMRTPFIVMCTVIQALYFSRVRVVSPMTVGAFFNLPKTRQAKKAAGVVVCKKHAVMEDVDKLDDLADAWMMTVWALVKRGAISARELQ